MADDTNSPAAVEFMRYVQERECGFYDEGENPNRINIGLTSGAAKASKAAPVPEWVASKEVSIGESDNQLERNIQRYTGKKKIKELELAMYGEKLCEGKAVMFSSGLAVLRLRKMEWSVRDCEVLQHELFHITHFIMRRVSI